MMKFSQDRLREQRQTHGLTLEQSAHRIGTTQNTLWRMEKGRMVPGANLLANIVTAYGCDFVDVFEAA